MSNSSEDLQDAHNQGQADGSNNEYSPTVPISPLDYLIHSDSTIQEWNELNEKYDEGWEHGYNQR